ncbi:hypothetical protein [Pedobacter mucosus]|uniref:hypothetical protein n=1 Tax=Pedobacter mucosus TaxID=2895286 RepID=UPI001EE41CA6|nr:hypothetical protein [Pedobacter mucosus]UKT62479.1 hypothetical protein LOK61_12000 [Pedobacter mucosus]
MRAELIQEFQLLQNSRANKFAEEISDKFISSIDAVNEKVASSLSKRGSMLLMLDRKLNFSVLKRLRKRFIK